MTVSIGKGAWLAVALLVGGAAAGVAVADQAVPDTPGARAVVARQHNYKQLGGAFKALTDELKKDTPDKAVIAANAEKMKGLVDQLPTWYPKGSGPEAHVKTAAKPIIWTDQAEFAAAAARLKDETGKLQQFSVAGDLGPVREQVRAVGGACKNCHDKFRVPDKS